MRTIGYAHGCKSSSRSRTVTQLRDCLRAQHLPVNFIAPDLSFDPDVALAQVELASRMQVLVPTLPAEKSVAKKHCAGRFVRNIGVSIISK